MKVLVLNHFAVPRNAPGGTRHVELFGRLERWSPTIIASNRNMLTREVAHDNDCLRTVWTTPFAASGPSRIANWASYALTAFVAGSRVRADVVYASSPHLLAGLAGWLLARLKRVPLVIEIRDLWPQVLVDMGQLDPFSRQFRVLKVIERFLYRRADAVVVLAQGSVESVVADGARADAVVFLPNGAEPSDFDVSEDRAALRKRFGMDGFVLLYAGAHGRANGLELVLDAAEELADRAPDVRFWLVGDGLVKPELQADAARRGLTNVVFHDPVPKHEVPYLLAAADVGMHVLADVPLFRHGVSPNKLFDYMAAGRPVLTNTPGEVTDLVERASSGIAVAPTELADGAARLAALSEAERDAFGANGRRFMEEHRSRTAISRQLEGLLDRVVSRGRRALR